MSDTKEQVDKPEEWSISDCRNLQWRVGYLYVIKHVAKEILTGERSEIPAEVYSRLNLLE
jgi:hypothetical protein